MKKNFFLVTIFLFVFISNAQVVKPVFTQDQLIDSIQKIVNTEHIPGLMVGITSRDSIILSRGFGYADLESKRLVDNKTLFRMGSNTKMFVSLGILKLIQDGKLNLNSEIKSIAPEIPFKNKWEVTNPLKIVHLLEHTSGFDDSKINRFWTLDTLPKSNFEMMMVQAPSMICRWEPGERYAYSNPNYAVLGYLIEKASKEPYEKYLTKTILTPLGMKNSNFNCYSKFPAKDVKEYVYRGDKISKVPSVTLLSGSEGSLWSCADDMLRFLQMFLQNGYPIFPENTITEMETVHSTLAANSGLKQGYALGNDVAHFDKKYLFRGHYGGIGSCESVCLYNRALGIGFTIASNGNNDNAEIEELITSFLEQNLPVTPVVTQPLDKQSIKPFLGFYQFHSPRLEMIAFIDWFMGGNIIYIKNDTLRSKFIFDVKPLAGIQIAPLIFRGNGNNTPSLVFTKTPNGKMVFAGPFDYSEKESFLAGICKRLAIVSMLVIISLSGIIAIFSLIKVFAGSGLWTALPIKFLPIVAFGFLFLSVFKLIEVDSYSYLLYELISVNGRTLVIYFGTLFFGIAALICFGATIYTLSTKKKKRLSEWFWVVTYLSVCIFAIILLKAGFIGLKTWAM